MGDILQAILIIGALNAVLAGLLVLAERFLVNFGECTININQNENVTVEGGQSLLASLNSEKIFLPSACGGRGTCAYCKCEVLEGGGPVLPTEETLLTSGDIDGGLRLACQLKVKNDIAIRIPDELFNIKEFSAEVSEIRDLTYDIKLLRLKLAEPFEINFTPGQYVQLQSEPYEGVRERVSRAYSIASAAGEKGMIDLMVRLVPDGICTTWVHEHLNEGDTVRFTGPMGDFGLRDGDGEIIMIAGGSGMAPMIPLLEEIKSRDVPRKTTYFFGAGCKKDLFYDDILEKYEKAIKHFTYVPALSKPNDNDQWTGATGLITEPLEAYLKESDTDRMQGYLCGSPGMIKACIKVLNKYGVDNSRIFFDPFA